jgi:hypothetical protein
MDKQIVIITKASYQLIKIISKYDLYWCNMISSPFNYYFSSFNSSWFIRYLELGSMFIFGNIFGISMMQNLLDNKYETIEITDISSVTVETEIVSRKNDKKIKTASRELVPLNPVMKNKATYTDPKDLLIPIFEDKKQAVDVKKPDIKLLHQKGKPQINKDEIIADDISTVVEIKKPNVKLLHQKGKQQITRDEIIADDISTIVDRQKTIPKEDYKKFISTMKKMFASNGTMSCDLIENSR